VKTLAALLLIAALPACTVALHGRQSSGGGTTTTSTASSINVNAGSGSGRVHASFGAPAPAHTTGGQVVFSRGASAVLVLGLVLAEAADYVARGFAPGSRPANPQATSIADTCSCYRPPPGADESRQDLAGSALSTSFDR
jgi:hypothetical protein